MAAFSQDFRSKRKTIGFVPTMGALHAGHLSLMRVARRENDVVVVSIFVNPLQFGPQEDFRRYPRDMKRDFRLCLKEGVDVIFFPDVRQMYPKEYKTQVTVEGLSDRLCGEFRPGHFKGVATVVAKLFNIVGPNIAYLGQKDAQQALIIAKLAEDLNMPLKVKIMPTVRERDGLAMSSRNIYLKPEERKDACVLYQALSLARELIKQGHEDCAYVIKKMRQLIQTKKTCRIQYVAIVDTKSLQSLKIIKKGALIALAVKIGSTRLIDNIIV